MEHLVVVASLSNIKLVLINSLWTNTLAYLSSLSVIKKKSFITGALGHPLFPSLKSFRGKIIR